MENNRKIKILAFLGTSGSGKTFVSKLLTEIEEGAIFTKTIQYTTRPIRRGEEPFIDYIFVNSLTEFEERIHDSKLRCLTEINGNRYGTSMNDLTEFKINMLILNAQGIRDLKAYIDKEENKGLYEMEVVRVMAFNGTPYETREGRDINVLMKEDEDIALVESEFKTIRINNFKTDSKGEFIGFPDAEEIYKELKEKIGEEFFVIE